MTVRHNILPFLSLGADFKDLLMIHIIQDCGWNDIRAGGGSVKAQTPAKHVKHAKHVKSTSAKLFKLVKKREVK